MSSSESHATVTYTSVSSNSEPWRFQWVSDDKPEVPQPLEHVPPSPDYVPGPEHPPSPDYVPGPEYPKYLVPFDDEVHIKDQPLLADASPTTLLSGYVADSDLEEDPKEDPTNYPADGGDDDDDDEEEEASAEEEHLALTDSTAPTLSPPKARMTVRHQPPIQHLWRYALLSIPSLPLSVPSPPLLIPSLPTHTSPTYDEAPLGYKAAMIRSRVASPSTHHPLLPSEIPSPPLLLPFTAHKDDIPEANMSLQKRAYITAHASRFKVGESSS
ncbi:hypothetical protein Tco_1087119, partial [Tanacetum coccineum]